jgi:hypothetical protein
MHTITRRSAPALLAALAGVFASPLAASAAADPVFAAHETDTAFSHFELLLSR